ncbi:thiamine monophosphate synthase [Marichromatium purpuratum 984]|uniref:8-oxo-dGTP diphosphatase n=1 Tax=Marichromatium purpuratum 984 TaxID=765910 RepID=W0E6M6_MARPU|nr:Nudix family hydrolase [Marichromatium purpuratum]AHF04864.1 thiamine monophosphate synthase [Marichromatium purpuratum 984]
MVGAIADHEGRILIARRPEGVHQGGLWEFPGGKLETGESPVAGLARELDEELGIRVERSRPLIRVRHHYGDRRVLLDVHRVERYVGVPEGREGQPLDWVHPEAMNPDDFPAADRPIITALRLPPLMLITGADPEHAEQFLRRLERALEGGVRLVQLRAHALGAADYRALAEQAFERCERHGAKLLLNRAPEEVVGVSRHGLHLGSSLLARLGARPGAPGELVGAACHDVAELDRIATLGLDYALLSPVKTTATHPGAPALGWSRFAAIAATANVPVYALGGMTRADLDTAWDLGAQGIAAIRGLWPGD